MTTLNPLIITTRHKFSGLAALNLPDTLGTLDANMDFALMSFNDQGVASISALQPGKPINKSADLGSLDEHNILYVIRGMGLYLLDISSNTYGYLNTGLGGNGGIRQVMMMDPEKRIIAVHFDEGFAGVFTLYDLIKQEQIIPNDYCFNGNLYPINATEFIGMFTDYNRIEWNLTNLKLDSPWSNELSRELTKFGIEISPRTKTFHLGKRFMIGTSWSEGYGNGTLVYYSIRWDEKMENVKVEPLTLQIPEGMYLNTEFVISPDGNFMKTYMKKLSPRGLGRDSSGLVIYHLSDLYPQGVSLPIRCDPTGETREGAFMSHSQWGPCYVEMDLNKPGKLFVYKLNEGLELLK